MQVSEFGQLELQAYILILISSRGSHAAILVLTCTFVADIFDTLSLEHLQYWDNSIPFEGIFGEAIQLYLHV